MVFEILGEPMGKQRPRFSRFGKYVHTYTPNKTVNYETIVKLEYKKVSNQYLTGMVSIDIKAYFGIPKSASIKKRAEMLQNKIRPTKKPDTDNICKIVCDALNGVAYKDDSQIVETKVNKYYDTTPRVVVEIKEI